mgnify:CR=1 FL=1
MKNFDLNSLKHQEILSDSEMKEIVGGSILLGMMGIIRAVSNSNAENSTSNASSAFEGTTQSGSTISGSQGG